MKTERISLVIACLALVAALPAMARQARVPKDLPELRSSGVMVFDDSNASVLLSRQANVPTPIASITKLMTALVVLDSDQPLDEMLVVSNEDREHGRGAGSRLPVGVRLSRADFLHLALMSSENRAAHTLGRSFPGGVPAFVQAMNRKAATLGMRSAHFVDPSGLSSENVASPADLVRLVNAAAQHPAIRQYSTDTAHSVRVGRRQLEYRNTDLLVRSPTWNIVVQKTGYITEAGRCLVLKAIIKGRSVVMVLLDSYGKYTRTADAQRIRKWLEARLGDVVAANPV